MQMSKCSPPASKAMGIVPELFASITDSLGYYRALLHFLLGGKWDTCPVFKDQKSLESQHAKVQTYSLGLIFYLWNRPHYRKGTYREDLWDNLRNVAIPGTGVALSVVARNKLFGLGFILFGNPVACAVAAWRSVGFKPWRIADALRAYREGLLRPLDWCSLWRLNCRLAAIQALRLMKSENTTSLPGGFANEDKWHFLKTGIDLGVPVTPVLDIPSLVVKDSNEEGGMGIHFFKNVTNGGRWIVQEAIENGEWLSKNILPPKSPLSTLRVMTASRCGMQRPIPKQVDDAGSDIEVISCCLRAGRAGASTDHQCVAFNVNSTTGELLGARQNQHWYRVGLWKGLVTGPWQDNSPPRDNHPDVPERTIGNCGIHIPDWEAIKKVVVDGHARMMPDVPLVGWDVALTSKGIMLLEVNLSCNFFLASFDVERYVHFVADYFSLLDRERHGGVFA